MESKMKLSDIIESSEPHQRVIWAVIQQEFDSLMKPIGHIENPKLYGQWLDIKMDSFDWIMQPKMTIEEEKALNKRIKEKERVTGEKIHCGISFNYACEIVRVKPETLMRIYLWAIAQNPPFTYFPVSVEFKNLRKQMLLKEEDQLEADEVNVNPDMEMPDSAILMESEFNSDEVLFKSDWYDDSLFSDDHFIIKAAIQTMVATAGGNE